MDSAKFNKHDLTTELVWKPLILLHVSSPERLSDGVGAQVNDFHQVVSGAGEQLGTVVVQVQWCDSAQQLQLTHNGLRPDARVWNADNAQYVYRLLSAWLCNTLKLMLWPVMMWLPEHQNKIERSHSPDVPESDFLVKVPAHDALLRANNIIAARTCEHSLHTCAVETGSQWYCCICTGITPLYTEDLSMGKDLGGRKKKPVQSRTHFAAEVP